MTGFAELKTENAEMVEQFVRENMDNLEQAELSIRRSKGLFVARLRSTDEPTT